VGPSRPDIATSDVLSTSNAPDDVYNPSHVGRPHWRNVAHPQNGGAGATRREIVAPERIVQTFEFEGMPGHVSVETLEFTEEGGKTTLTSTTPRRTGTACSNPAWRRAPGRTAVESDLSCAVTGSDQSRFSLQEND
jgi:hypothetical protein